MHPAGACCIEAQVSENDAENRSIRSSAAQASSTRVPVEPVHARQEPGNRCEQVARSEGTPIMRPAPMPSVVQALRSTLQRVSGARRPCRRPRR